jgi:hypothetical protein
MAKIRKTREGHENHICALAEGGSIGRDLEGFKELVGEPRFVCRRCGRAAKSAESLCEPEGI